MLGQKIRVLHVIGGGEFGGAEQHLLTLLKNINRQEFDVEAACLFAAPLAGLLNQANIKHRVFPMASKKDFKVISRLAEYIKEREFDILHTHGVRANLIGRLAARKAGVQNVVTTVHSVLEYDYPNKLDLWINKTSEKLTSRFTKHFIAVSDSLAEYVREAFGVGKRKVTTIHNGLELHKYSPRGDSSAVKKKLGIGEEEVVLGVVSRLHPVKGHRILFYAFQTLIKEFPFLRLLVVGTGPDKDPLLQKADELGIAKYVIFTGFTKDVIQMYEAMDIVVQPSLSEGFGLTAIEAMAMGRPVVASKVGGLQEIIKDRSNGLLFTAGDPVALADAVISLLELPGRARELARAGRETVEKHYSAKGMAQKTEEVYSKMVRRQKRRKVREQKQRGIKR